MKVGIITPFFYPHIGGMEKSLYNLSLGLKNRGFDVVVFTTKQANKEFYSNLKFKVCISSGNELKKWSEEINSFLDDHNDCEVLIYGGIGKDVLSGIISSLHKSKILRMSSVLRVPTSDHLQRHLKEFNKKEILNLFDKIVCIDEVAVSFLKDKLSIDEITYIPNGVNTEVYKPTKAFKVRSNTFIYIGRISTRKRIEKVIDIAKNLPQGYRIIVQGSKSFGESYYYERMMSILKKIDNVELVNEGWNNSKYYQEAGYYVLPSTSEGCPNSILEAMSSEIYCFVSDIPENQKIVGENGSVIDFNNENYFENILTIISNPKYVISKIKQGRKIVTNSLSISITIKKWEQLLLSFAKSKIKI